MDRKSGTVLSYSYRPDEADGEYADIVRFDVNEARTFYGDEWPSITALGIIRIGFWNDAGVYTPNERADLDGAAERDAVEGGC